MNAKECRALARTVTAAANSVEALGTALSQERPRGPRKVKATGDREALRTIARRARDFQTWAKWLERFAEARAREVR